MHARPAASALAFVSCALLGGCASSSQTPSSGESDRALLPFPADPPARTPYHAQPCFEKARSENVVLWNHAEPSFALGSALQALQAQYAWLRSYVSAEPGLVHVHVGYGYPSGFSISAPEGGAPEMFLRAESFFDSQADYAHEMMHCFTFRFGAQPHWFFESIADVAWIDSEIELYGRRKDPEFLERFDRVDHRSFELIRLRAQYGPSYFPRVFRWIETHRAERERALATDATLEQRNAFLLQALSACASEDLLPLFTREWGFDLRTRERQRGY